MILFLLFLTAQVFAEVPYPITDTSTNENFSYLDKTLETTNVLLERHTDFDGLAYSGYIVTNEGGTANYALWLASDGAIVIQTTTTVATSKFLFFSTEDGVTYRISVASDGALQMNKLGFTFTGNNLPLVKTGSNSLYVLGIYRGTFNTTYLGELP